MSRSVRPKAVGKVLADRVVADADIFEKFAQHYMGIIMSKKKLRNCLPQNGLRRSERLMAKRKITNEDVCTKKIKTRKTKSSYRKIPFHKLVFIAPRENVVKISDDDDLEIIDPVPEPASCHPQIDSNNNQDVAAIPIEVDSSSDEESDQNESRGLQLPENEGGRQVSHNVATSCQIEDRHFPNLFEQNIYEAGYSLNQTIEQDLTSSSSIRSTSTSVGYHSYSHIMTSHEAYTQYRETYIPNGGIYNRYQEMPMTGEAPYSNVYSCNEYQQSSTPLSLPPPEQAAHCFSEELPSNSAHCVFQVNQITELTTINDRLVSLNFCTVGSNRAEGAGDASDSRRGGVHISDAYIDIRKMATSDNNSLTRTGIFSIYFGNNQHAYISGHMFFNSEEDNSTFEQHFSNQPRMSNDVSYQNFNTNYHSQHYHVNQPQCYQPSGHEYEQPIPVNYEDQSVTINNSGSNNAQSGHCNIDCSLSPPNVQGANSNYETIEILDSDDECPDNIVSEITFPTSRSATGNPRLNLLSLMTMVSNGELSLSVAEQGRTNALRPHPLNGNVRIRIDLQENAIGNSQTGIQSMEWDNLDYSHVFSTVTYKVIYGNTPGQEAIQFNNVFFVDGNQHLFYRYIPWLLGLRLWYQRHFISWVVDCEEIQ